MLLRLEQLTKSFGGLVAVRSVDLEVREGEILGLIGPNGSGKTTLFNLISGLYGPDSGRVVLDGIDVTSWSPPRRCKQGIARTFQLVRPFQHLTVLQNVAVGRAYGREAATSRARAETDAHELLELVGLGDRPNLPASKLTLVLRSVAAIASRSASRSSLPARSIALARICTLAYAGPTSTSAGLLYLA